jgi:abhydrolase domain-containing protein 4
VQFTKTDVIICGNKKIVKNFGCNFRGETAFHKMIRGFGWAKNPMLNRIHKLDNGVPITLMNGSNTWMDKSVGKKLQEMRQNSYVRLEIISEAGHHVHADNPESFNEIVVDVCNLTEKELRQVNKIISESESLQDEEEIVTEKQIVSS